MGDKCVYNGLNLYCQLKCALSGGILSWLAFEVPFVVSQSLEHFSRVISIAFSLVYIPLSYVWLGFFPPFLPVIQFCHGVNGCNWREISGILNVAAGAKQIRAVQQSICCKAVRTSLLSSL